MMHAVYSRHGAFENEPCKTYAEAEAYLLECDRSDRGLPLAIYDDVTGDVWPYGRLPHGVERDQLDRQALEAIRTALAPQHELQIAGYF
jgi:hypothetical protein